MSSFEIVVSIGMPSSILLNQLFLRKVSSEAIQTISALFFLYTIYLCSQLSKKKKKDFFLF